MKLRHMDLKLLLSIIYIIATGEKMGMIGKQKWHNNVTHIWQIIFMYKKL